MARGVCVSGGCIDGSSPFFDEVNLKGDLGDLGDFGRKGDLVFGLSMSSWASLPIVGPGSVSGCGVDFRAILSPCRVFLASSKPILPQIRRLPRVYSRWVPESVSQFPKIDEIRRVSRGGTCESLSRIRWIRFVRISIPTLAVELDDQMRLFRVLRLCSALAEILGWYSKVFQQPLLQRTAVDHSWAGRRRDET